MTDTNKFFSIIDDLYDRLNTSETRTDIMNRCVEDRLSSILKLQASEFDAQLESLQKVVNLDLRDIRNMKQMGHVLTSLHKCIALDRLRLLDNLIALAEV